MNSVLPTSRPKPRACGRIGPADYTGRWTLLPVAALVALCAACSGGGGDAPTAAPAPGIALVELEPNDDPATAQDLGQISPGDLLELRGAVSAAGADQFDTFRFTATAGLTVAFELVDDAAGADLDLWRLDGEGRIAEAFEAPEVGLPQVGSFAVGAGELVELVVFAFEADAAYTLNLTALP